MATTDLKVMVKQALEKDAVFFDEAVTRLTDLRFYISRFNANYDDLIVEKIDEYSDRLIELRAGITGPEKKEKIGDGLKHPPKYDKTKPPVAENMAKTS